MKYCILCGKELQDDMGFCPYCGKQQGDIGMQNPMQGQTKPKKKHPVRNAILLIFFLLLVFIVVFSVRSYKDYMNMLEFDPFNGMTVEEFKNTCQEVSYTDLARYPEKYEDKQIKISGTVIQVIESENYCEYRIATDIYYGDVVFGTWIREEGAPRLLENDEIIIYGWGRGLITYTSTMEVEITIPAIYIVTVDYSE